MTEYGGPRGRVLDKLDQRVACALQVDGRASWTSIAEALGESERTVTRRGTRLLNSRAMIVAGRPRSESNVIVNAYCALGQYMITARAFAQRSDSFLVHVLTGSPECLVQLNCPTERLSRLVLEELPGVRGLTNTFTQPVLRQVHSIHKWRPEILTSSEIAALSRNSPPEGAVSDRAAHPAEPDKASKLIQQVLATDGRSTVEELSRLTRLSDATVRRRLERMRQDGDLVIRAIIEPSYLGLAVEAVLRIRARPDAVDSVATALGQSPFVRYISIVFGERQILAMVAVPNEAALYDFVTQGSWLKDVRSADTALILRTLKRGGVLTSSAEA